MMVQELLQDWPQEVPARQLAIVCNIPIALRVIGLLLASTGTEFHHILAYTETAILKALYVQENVCNKSGMDFTCKGSLVKPTLLPVNGEHLLAQVNTPHSSHVPVNYLLPLGSGEGNIDTTAVSQEAQVL